jgi:hypothetical protein
VEEWDQQLCRYAACSTRLRRAIDRLGHVVAERSTAAQVSGMYSRQCPEDGRVGNSESLKKQTAGLEGKTYGLTRR